jgi:hypothetical protein
MRVYHLKESKFAIENIALCRIKVSRFSDLNDPFELLGAELRNKELREAFRQTKEHLDKNRGLICFSKSWGNPVLWSHYADKHRGICLGFDVPDEVLAPIIYTKDPLKVPKSEKKAIPKINYEFMNGLLRTKFEDWRYEEECRLFINLDHNCSESGLYFYSFNESLVLKEVILGPRCEIPISEVRQLVSKVSPQVKVIKAMVAFTKFKVIENRAETRKKA